MNYAARHQNLAAAIEVAAATVGLCLFALCAHDGFPWRLAAASGLVIVAFALHRAIVSGCAPAEQMGLRLPTHAACLHLALGLALGVVLAVGFRERLGNGLFPGALTRFSLLAALIGAAEELFYRGYILGRLRFLGTTWAVVLSAVAHTAYKCALFARPQSGIETNFLFLAVATLLGGLTFGLLRMRAGSVWPAVAAHACFDVLVYGDRAQAPWWVWQ